MVLKLTKDIANLRPSFPISMLKAKNEPGQGKSSIPYPGAGYVELCDHAFPG
jgi:hypothetical protein